MNTAQYHITWQTTAAVHDNLQHFIPHYQAVQHFTSDYQAVQLQQCTATCHCLHTHHQAKRGSAQLYFTKLPGYTPMTVDNNMPLQYQVKPQGNVQVCVGTLPDNHGSTQPDHMRLIWVTSSSSVATHDFRKNTTANACILSVELSKPAVSGAAWDASIAAALAASGAKAKQLAFMKQQHCNKRKAKGHGCPWHASSPHFVDASMLPLPGWFTPKHTDHLRKL